VPGDRGLWLKTKCLNREEFVVVGWTDHEGSRPFIGALLIGHYDQARRLVYAGRVGTGMRADQLATFCGAFDRYRSTGYRSTSRRRAQPGSARRWCSHGCIGCGLNFSSSSNT
jgi:ATP-dependent DNA ligase